MGAQLALAQYSQGDELESDAYGIKYMRAAGYDPQAAVELQELFLQLSEGRDSDWLSGLFASHPPSARRVQANQQLVQEIGGGGYRGREAYQHRIALIKKLQPAYDAHDKAMKLASEGDFDGALASVNQAIKAEPREAMFFALRGRIYKAQDQPEKARADFDKAVSLYPEMFEYQLYNGLNELALNNLTKARQHLERANQVVPTSIAYLRLGDISRQQGQRNEAVRYYSAAAEAGGDVGEEAKRKLAAMTN